MTGFTSPRKSAEVNDYTSSAIYPKLNNIRPKISKAQQFRNANLRVESFSAINFMDRKSPKQGDIINKFIDMNFTKNRNRTRQEKRPEWKQTLRQEDPSLGQLKKAVQKLVTPNRKYINPNITVDLSNRIRKQEQSPLDVQQIEITDRNKTLCRSKEINTQCDMLDSDFEDLPNTNTKNLSSISSGRRIIPLKSSQNNYQLNFEIIGKNQDNGDPQSPESFTLRDGDVSSTANVQVPLKTIQKYFAARQQMPAQKLYKLKKNKVQLLIKEKKYVKTKLSFDTAEHFFNQDNYESAKNKTNEVERMVKSNDYQQTMKQHSFMRVDEPKYSSQSSMNQSIVQNSNRKIKKRYMQTPSVPQTPGLQTGNNTKSGSFQHGEQVIESIYVSQSPDRSVVFGRLQKRKNSETEIRQIEDISITPHTLRKDSPSISPMLHLKGPLQTLDFKEFDILSQLIQNQQQIEDINTSIQQLNPKNPKMATLNLGENIVFPELPVAQKRSSVETIRRWKLPQATPVELKNVDVPQPIHIMDLGKNNKNALVKKQKFLQGNTNTRFRFLSTSIQVPEKQKKPRIKKRVVQEFKDIHTQYYHRDVNNSQIVVQNKILRAATAQQSYSDEESDFECRLGPGTVFNY